MILHPVCDSLPVLSVQDGVLTATEGTWQGDVLVKGTRLLLVLSEAVEPIGDVPCPARPGRYRYEVQVTSPRGDTVRVYSDDLVIE